MDDGLSRRPWGVGQRLEFIEFRLFWEGQINRVDLTNRFGISAPQASTDFTKYLELAPKNLVYEPRQRAYVAGPEFTPVLHEPNARQYLADLRGIADDAIEKDRTWLGAVPEFEIAPTPRRRLDPSTLRAILVAIRRKQSLRVRYHSMTSGDASERWLAPHALAYDGMRWHARAWCDSRREFRDFALARILGLSGTRPRRVDPAHDVEWAQPAILKIGPRSELNANQQRVLALEYGMEDGVLEISLRFSMAYYLERNLLLDHDAAGLPPKRAQLQLLNRQALDDLRAKITEEKNMINEAIGEDERDTSQ